MDFFFLVGEEKKNRATPSSSLYCEIYLFFFGSIVFLFCSECFIITKISLSHFRPKACFGFMFSVTFIEFESGLRACVYACIKFCFEFNSLRSKIEHQRERTMRQRKRKVLVAVDSFCVYFFFLLLFSFPYCCRLWQSSDISIGQVSFHSTF